MSFSYYGLEHVQVALPAGRGDLAREFYRDVLGMVEIEKPETLKKRGGLWYLCGVHQIHLGVDHDFKPAQQAHPAIHVNNIEELKRSILSKGIALFGDELLPSAKRFYVNDPLGNRLEFLEWIECSFSMN